MREKYKLAGVDIELADNLIAGVKDLIKKTYSSNVLEVDRGFCGYFRIGDKVLAATADGVGTKVRIALRMNKLFGIGIDLVAMNVNDIIAGFSYPLFFLDYIQMNKLQRNFYNDLIKGMVYACKTSMCALLGGETAEHPSKVRTLELAGFCVGENVRFPDYNKIEKGDVIIGLSSSGIHSNGFSLVNKIIEEKGYDLKEPATKFISDYSGNESFGEYLLTPTEIYVQAFKGLLEDEALRGIANITGGGIIGNIERILPDGKVANIYTKNIPYNPVFGFIQKEGGVSFEEMYGVFNMGVGIVAIVKKGEEGRFLEHFRRFNKHSFLLGEITVEEKKAVRIIDGEA